MRQSDMTTGCPHHESIQYQHDRNAQDHTEFWNAIGELRKDIKDLIGKIGLLVGGISVLNSVVMFLIQRWGD